MKLYFVATFEDAETKANPLNHAPDKRIVGYFLDLETAKECVEQNWGDLYEDGYYKYAVIEDVEPGLYRSVSSKPIFYKWVGDIDTGGYIRIRRPKCWKNTWGFTIG